MQDKRIEKWTADYKALADKIVTCQVKSMQDEFPDEEFPVRPTLP